jgi:preprotein translocase subunit SecY
MTILRDVLAELVGMFLGDAWLATAVLALVAVVAMLVDFAGLDALIGGAGLLIGCLAILTIVTAAEARQRRRK